MAVSNKWLERSFWLLVVFGASAFVLSWKLGSPVPFTTVASVGLGGWFTRKVVQARNNP